MRNPWDAYVSGYWWRNSGQAPDDFADVKAQFKRWLLAGEGRRNFAIISIDGQIAADFVGQYEHLKTDLGRVQEQVGLPTLRLPREESPLSKSGYRAKGDRYQDYYDAESVAYVGNVDAPLIEHFGYEF